MATRLEHGYDAGADPEGRLHVEAPLNAGIADAQLAISIQVALGQHTEEAVMLLERNQLREVRSKLRGRTRALARPRSASARPACQ